MLQDVSLGQKSLADYTHICGRDLIEEIRGLAEPRGHRLEGLLVAGRLCGVRDLRAGRCLTGRAVRRVGRVGQVCRDAGVLALGRGLRHTGFDPSQGGDDVQDLLRLTLDLPTPEERLQAVRGLLALLAPGKG